MPLFIYTDNIEKNVDTIRKYTNKDIIAVVKSNAYGLGSRKIIEILKKMKVNFYAFEKNAEYQECKDLLKNNNVLIMESTSAFENNFNIRYSINNIIDVYNIKNINYPVKVHIRVDTGMNRFGIKTIHDFKKILSILKINENIFIEGIYTHFSSDEFESNYFEKQVEKFKKLINIKKFDIIHANATRNLHKKIIGNFVRVGIGLYGYHNPYLKLIRSVSLNAQPKNIFKTSQNTKISYCQKKSKEELIGVINY